MVFLELRRDSRVTTGNSGCLLCWPRQVPNTTVQKHQFFGPITSWQIDGETVETVRDYLFGLQNHCRWYCSHEIEKRLLLGRKGEGEITQSFLTLCDPVNCSLPGFSVHGILQARTLGRRIDAFELWYWRRLLRVPWTARRSNLSILKEISPGCSVEGMMLKLKLQYFGLKVSWLGKLVSVF